MSQKLHEELKTRATNMRKNIIRMITQAKSGHPGGSLSAADIVATLYFYELRVDPNNPTWEDRDRFVLTKGHAAPVLYAALAEKGFFPEEELLTLRQVNSRLQGHPDMKKVPGVDMSTGSLGQGLSTCVGMALASKLDKKDYRIYAYLGDGELQEGQVWEAAMAAAHYQLDNLVGFVDLNNLQIDGTCSEVMCPHPVDAKFEAFGWYVINIDGHDYGQIIDALAKAKEIKGKPVMVVAKTVKGKGVSFMENGVEWHGSAPSEDQRDAALAELDSILQS